MFGKTSSLAHDLITI